MSESALLHEAIQLGDIDKIEELVRSGVDLGAKDRLGRTPLVCAIIFKQKAVAELLAKNMTDQDLAIVDGNLDTMLHWIAFFGRPWAQLMQDISDQHPYLLEKKDIFQQRPIDVAKHQLPEHRDVYNIFERLEREQKQRQQQQYTTGIAENVEKPCNINITVVGHNGVGKSCFVRQLKQEYIPEGGPGSTDTADFYINHLVYNRFSGTRQTLEAGEELETGRQRLKRIIDRYKKNESTAVQPSTDLQHDTEEASTSTSNLPEDLAEASGRSPDQLAAFLHVPTVDASSLSSAKPKRDIKQKLKRFITRLSFRRKRKEKVVHTEKEYPTSKVHQRQLPQEQQRKDSTSSEKEEHNEMPTEQESVIDAVMRTKIYDDMDEVWRSLVTIYDFGGEKVFYNTHHCFMSSNMVFVLVFDVAMCLDPSREKDGYERIEFWLRSIATYAVDRAEHGKGTPPIILVGSHLDLLSPNKKEQRHLFASVLDKLYEKPELRQIMETHVQDMFPIADLHDSSKNQTTYQQVWEKIIEIAPLQSQWMKPVPARWIALEHELVRLKNSGKVILTYDKLLEINRELAVPLEEDDIIKFLWKLKFFGSFLCFDLHSKRPFIVLQAQWIINAFKSIITDPKFITDVTTKQSLEWKSYQESGVLPVEFIRQLWGRYEKCRFLEEEKKLYIALETLGLLSKPLSVDAEVNYFVVPSILQTADPETIRPLLVDSDTVTTVALCLVFDNPFIPQAVWDKLIAACIHRFHRLAEHGLDRSKYIQRGFVCLQVDCLWNMIINCKGNTMKMVMFTRSRNQEVLLPGTGISLRKVTQDLLMRILELNFQSHLKYHFLLHNDYRFTHGEKRVRVEDLHLRESAECFGQDGSRWIHRKDMYVWFEDDKQNKKLTHQPLTEETKDLPDRNLSFREIGRLSRYVRSSHLTFFVELDCPVEIVEQEMEEHRHLAFRSRITKVLLHLCKLKADISFGAIAYAMSTHGMDSTKLMNILDSTFNVNNVYDQTLPDNVLHHCLSLEDASNIADHVDIKTYFNLFLELGYSPAKIDDFDDLYRHVKTREKVATMLEAFIKDTSPTVNTLLLAMQECDMDTKSLIAALKPP